MANKKVTLHGTLDGTVAAIDKVCLETRKDGKTKRVCSNFPARVVVGGSVGRKGKPGRKFKSVTSAAAAKSRKKAVASLARITKLLKKKTKGGVAAARKPSKPGATRAAAGKATCGSKCGSHGKKGSAQAKAWGACMAGCRGRKPAARKQSTVRKRAAVKKR